jgi:hypothetical protein
LGKFIKGHNESVDISNYVSAWFSFLPLRHDKPEAIVQHELLVIFVIILVRHYVKEGHVDFGSDQRKQVVEHCEGAERVRRHFIEFEDNKRCDKVEDKGALGEGEWGGVVPRAHPGDLGQFERKAEKQLDNNC